MLVSRRCDQWTARSPSRSGRMTWLTGMTHDIVDTLGVETGFAGGEIFHWSQSSLISEVKRAQQYSCEVNLLHTRLDSFESDPLANKGLPNKAQSTFPFDHSIASNAAHCPGGWIAPLRQRQRVCSGAVAVQLGRSPLA